MHTMIRYHQFLTCSANDSLLFYGTTTFFEKAIPEALV